VSQRQGSRAQGCLGLLVVITLLAWPIEMLGHLVGWSSATKGWLELASLAVLAIGLRLRSRPVPPRTAAARSRMIPSVQRLDLRAAPETTQRQSSTARREPIPAQLRFKVLQRDGFRCQYCGRGAREDGVVLHADHVIPVVAGGETNEGNLMTACASCNLGKAARAVLH
jgi:5-methylcytosine-specific restriction endonuclease McrA